MQDARLEVVTARSKRDTPHEKASHEVAASVEGRLQRMCGTGGVNSAWGMVNLCVHVGGCGVYGVGGTSCHLMGRMVNRCQ